MWNAEIKTNNKKNNINNNNNQKVINTKKDAIEGLTFLLVSTRRVLKVTFPISEKHRMQHRVTRNSEECSVGQCGKTVKISQPSGNKCGVGTVRKMELHVRGVSDCTPCAVIMFLIARNENTSVIHR